MRVAVVGAGIGGLSLAHGLLRAGLDVTVYERDQALDSRRQGYRLHLDAGAALHACLPPDLYELCVATSGRPGTAMTVVTERLRPLRRTETGLPADPGNPAALSVSVNRQTFREILAARLDGVIEFGRSCAGFEQDPGGVVLRFGDGSQAAADVLVAADGISSPIRRRYLPDARLTDTGIVCVYGRTPLTGQTRPLVPAPAWDGFTAVVGSRVGMATGVLDFREPPGQAARRLAPDARLSPASSYLMWAITGGAGHFSGSLDGLSPAGLHAVALRTIRGWHPRLRQLVELACVRDTSLIAVRTAVPLAPWPASRVTLLGDAIHAMLPTLGQGANMALRDAGLLAGKLADGAGDPLAAIAAYEREMRDYVYPILRLSADHNRFGGGGLAAEPAESRA
jgi:2-polyprenyl-6-methoxyphenol hydroxylase-like FAD-dependent oxidoreductase